MLERRRCSGRSERWSRPSCGRPRIPSCLGQKCLIGCEQRQKRETCWRGSQFGIVGPEMSGPPLLGILWQGRLGGPWILLNLIPFQSLLRALSFFILELLESGQSFLRVFEAMKAPVNYSELIPSLLDNIEVR